MKNKNKQMLIQVNVLLITFILSKTLFSNEYLFGWINHNYYFFVGLSALAIIFGYFNKGNTSLLITLALSLGLIISNYLGKFYRLYNISKINDAMDAQKIANLHLNYSFVLWLILIGLSIISGLILDRQQKEDL